MFASSSDGVMAWLDDPPEGWEVRPLKYAASINSEALKDDTDPDFEFRYIDITSVTSNGSIEGGDTVRFESAPSRARRKVRRGDTILATVRTYLKAIAFIDEQQADSIVSTGFAVLRPRADVLPRFLWRYVQSEPFVNAVVARSTGVSYPAINPSELGSLPVFLPPLETQRTIADFLDRATAKIVRLIEQKQRLLELLDEKRTALITQAVTKGLDPDVEMKDSGVEWLGEIPAHWDVVRCGWLASIGNGSTPGRGDDDYWQEGSIPWLTSARINDEVIREAAEFVTPLALRKCHLPLVPEPSVLVAITGEGQTRGRAALLRIPSTISQHLAYLTPTTEELEAAFLWRFLQAQYSWLRHESSGGGSTRAALTCDFLRNVPIVLPPLEEQAGIIEHLDERSRDITALLERVGDAIEYLREYRRALISSAITGAMDARGLG